MSGGYKSTPVSCIKAEGQQNNNSQNEPYSIILVN